MDRNEAIKVIKHNFPEGRHQLSEALKTLIPELNESEDERNQRIKKEVIEMLHYYHSKSHCFIPPQFSLEETLAWLESKVIPKFKVGDWIVYLNEDVIMITGVADNGYLINKGGFLPFTSQGSMRYWTIQDAKDGDVLAEGSCIFILKEMVNDFHEAITYCTLFNDGEFHDGETLHFDIGSTRPATEEQHNLLFLKMKEAGYNFDPEKKELRKIEQKNTEWSEEDEIICQCLIKDQEEALDKVSNSKYGHSEIISDLKETYNEHIDWLKSLKERYTWKPSDDQMEALKDVVRLYKSTHFDSHHYKIETLYEDLKKLR